MNKPLHILVADDDQDDHDLFREAINLTGTSYHLIQVHNGEEGCAVYFAKPARLDELKASIQKMIGDLS